MSQKAEKINNFFISLDNTSLAAPGALAHRLQRRPCLQHLTARLIQNGRRGLEIG